MDPTNICAEFMMVDPPGTQIFIPGEIITKENIQYIVMNTEAELPVQGPETTLQTIRVIKDRKGINSTKFCYTRFNPNKKAEQFAHTVVAF